MDLIANSWLFRAEAMRLDWGAALERQIAFLRQSQSPFIEQVMPKGDVREAAKRRGGDVHVWWACSRRLGVPRGAFTVWTRLGADDALARVDLSPEADAEGVLFTWGPVEAAVVEVQYTPVDIARATRVQLHRTSGALRDLVAAVPVPAGSGDPTVVRLRCSGATSVRVDNGSVTSVRLASLADVVNAPDWKPVELVGLPCDDPWSATAYDSSPQGLLDDLTSPVEAAVGRLKRGAPPFGWWPLTQSGRIAPAWQSADPEALVKEVCAELLPELEPMYAAGVREWAQWALEQVRAVAGPTQDGRSSSLDTAATIRPFSLLVLPAQTDPLLNLATGFGTTYGFDTRLPVDYWPNGEQQIDFMVTADYSSLGRPRRGKGRLAAYAPQVGPHVISAPATGLEAERVGLVGPAHPNEPWRESVRVSWDALPTTALLGRVSAGVLGRYDASGSVAECLAPPRDSGGYRPLSLSPDAPAGEAGHDRIAFADGGVDIPIGSGGRDVGYGVTLVDVHGVWSAWRDVAYAGDEPGPQAPRVVSLALDSSFGGNAAACPGTLRLEVAVNWAERTPAHVVGRALYFPMATALSEPPVGLGPEAPTPPGCFRRDFALSFPSDTPTPNGCTVSTLSADGTTVVPAGPGQGDGGRRYAIEAAIPTLDWTVTGRWGVRVWLRSHLSVGVSPTAWVPGDTHPARAVAASPVPVVPLPPPAPPGVPLGSTVDSQGCSHIRVHWSLPGGSGGGGVRTSVVWEVSETALRLHRGLTPKAPETDPPGVRLAALWAAYDELTETARRAAFRRIREVDVSTTSVDVALPKGSTDIHLFTVTTQSMTGIESPWPGAGNPDAHLHLQAAIAPRLVQPSPPLARTVVNDDGSLTVRLLSASRAPVDRFLVFATRSEAAARDRESMGPPVASVAVVGPPTGTDPVTNAPIYEATWSGVLTSSWSPWLIRAVARPVDTLPVQGVRGVTSAASEIGSVLVPPSTPPDLDGLAADLWGADHDGVVVRTSTSAPVGVLASGAHRLGGTAGDVVLPAVALSTFAESALTSPPADANTTPVIERGVRTAGRTPLALWFRRPVATDPVTVTLRLLDPFGRVTERVVAVPGWVPPPPFTVTIAGVTARPAGVLVGVDSDASAAAAAGVVMHVRALKRRVFGGGGRLGPIRWPLLTVVEGDFVLAAIPLGLPIFPSDGAIHVVRSRAPFNTARFAVWIPVLAPLSIAVTLTDPDGATATATGSV
ncbi:hypothetical protein BA895_01845 [Humibacillus sp. DSM 29435]|uniref:hypothetical protein n=1 Tax=Humibacillus sp. DSM 29435 TaxID=1869167 RepID=UPI0008722F3B|nr:hypothetical protein [Humibacillus sp. DSM 29435]OFE18927.1 hypothetical protein BA895_01845 [Humibacillus sp. DSM 29435]